jgi:hypothetical protein
LRPFYTPADNISIDDAAGETIGRNGHKRAQYAKQPSPALSREFS